MSTQIASLPPEVRALVISAGAPAEPTESPGPGHQLPGEIDWPRLLRAAHRHGLFPLLARALENGLLPAAPPEIGDEIRRLQRDLALESMELSAHLLRVLDTFAARGLRALAFKGPALATASYGDLSLRNSVDLDLLVRPHDLPAARGALEDSGHQPILDLTEAQERIYLRSAHAFVYRPLNARFTVDLHWALTQAYFGFGPRLADWFARSAVVEVGARRVATFSPEDSLLHLSVHGCKHNWAKLLWLADVAATLRTHPHLDAGRVYEQSSDLRCRRMVTLALSLSHRLLGTPAPATLHPGFSVDTGVERLVSEVAATFVEQHPVSTAPVRKAALHLRCRDSLADRGAYVFRKLTGPTFKEAGVVALPPSLDFFYRGLRPMRLLANLGRRGREDD